MSPSTEFWRASGAGNDFLALVEPADDPSARQITAWCRRGVGLGADGVFALRRTASQAGATVAMRYWNADGGAAELCVNATRCAARLAFTLGWAVGSVAIETGAGTLQAHDAGDLIELEAPLPERAPVELALGAHHDVGSSRLVVVGVPHLVLAWNGALDEAPVAGLGARLRADPRLGPSGANVDFVHRRSRSEIELRTFERGVEAETLACGSGVLAAVAVGWAAGELDPVVEALTLGGFRFRVSGALEGERIATWRLAGDARLLAHGEILPGAEVEVEPARWS